MRENCIGTILRLGSVPPGCRTRSHANTRKQTENGRGSTSFQRPHARSMRAPVLFAAITSPIRRSSAREATGRARCRAHEASDSAHVAPLLRDPFAGVGLRYPDRARIARAHRRQHDDDLYTRPQSWWPWSDQPVRWMLISDRSRQIERMPLKLIMMGGAFNCRSAKYFRNPWPYLPGLQSMNGPELILCANARCPNMSEPSEGPNGQ